MKALMVQPGLKGSLQLEEIKEPPSTVGSLLVSSLALGVCGTDRELIAGLYGSPPAGHKRLVIGHESLGVVEEAPTGALAQPGDLVIPFVRMPDPKPCDCCAVGQWDRCRNGDFTEHGIKSVDGFGRERYRVAADRVLIADKSLGLTAVLGEPASVVAKAWEQIDRVTVGECWMPRRALISGAGPVGLLAGLIGRERGLEVHLFDRDTDGPKPSLARDLGATYHTGDFAKLPADFDIVLECTGAPPLAMRAVTRTHLNGVVCLLGVSGDRPPISIDAGEINDCVVLGNRIVIGSVNANRSHYEAGHAALLRADRRWLDRLITRRIPFAEAERAFEPTAGDVKTVIVFDRMHTILRSE
jgi:threonine dehydrogenase-like Zn-dependent dehydrogenase